MRVLLLLLLCLFFRSQAQIDTFTVERKLRVIDTNSLEGRLASIDQIIEKYRAVNSSIAIGVFQGDEVLFRKAYGDASCEQKIPATTSTVYDIASLSKQFTATCILLLEEKGKIGGKDKVSKYLPDLNLRDELRIEHLIHHCSGLPNYLQLKTDDPESLRKEKIQEWIQTQPILFQPGFRFDYCPTNYLLLAWIIEEVSGEDLRSFAKKMIFDPLCMESTRFEEPDSTWMMNRASGYKKIRKTLHPDNFHNLNVGDGGVLTTIDDLQKWHANFFNNQLGIADPDLFKKQCSTIPLASGEQSVYAYGLGYSEFAGVLSLTHNGRSWGYSAKMRLFPDSQIGIYVLSNCAYPDEEGPYRICNKVTELLLY